MHKLKKIQGTVGEADEGSAEDISLEGILQGGLIRGLRMQDTEIMTLGMWIDYVIEWNNIHMTSNVKTNSKRASQAEYDAF